MNTQSEWKIKTQPGKWALWQDLVSDSRYTGSEKPIFHFLTEKEEIEITTYWKEQAAGQWDFSLTGNWIKVRGYN